MGASGVVIVGGGLAAVRVAEQLRSAGDERPITIVSAESYPPYDRPPLSKEFLVDSTRGPGDVALKPAEFYTEKTITLQTGTPARSLDTAAQKLTLDDGSVLGYDELIIATGLIPRRIASLPDLPGIHVLRSLDDASALRRHSATARHAVIIGAGFIGCEVAASLRTLGLDVVLVEPQPTPLAGVLGQEIGQRVARLHRSEGVDVRTGTGVSEVRSTGDGYQVVLGDGDVIKTDLVVIGVGSRPATDWLTGSGVELDPADGGVLCDAVGRTSAARVWALGDVAAWIDTAGHRARVEHWSNVADQARVLVAALLGKEAPSVATVPYFWSDQYDVKFQCLGDPQASDTVHVVEDDGRKFLAYYERDGVLAAVVGGGMPGKVMKARGKILAGAPIDEVL